MLTTWDVSLAAAERKNPIAGDLLRLFAFLAPEAIPRALVIDHAPALPKPLAEVVADRFTFNRSVMELGCYSLIKATPDGQAFVAHRLVQAVTRTRLPNPLPWADAAIALVNAAFPNDSDDVRFWPICASLRSHAEAALTVAQNLPTNAVHTSRLLDRLATYLQSQGLYQAAQPLFERALVIREQALGPEHPEVATSLNSLARLYDTQGHYPEAEPLFQRALAIQEKTLGPEHPEVATNLNSLARLYHEQGRYAEAEPLFQRALAIREETLGPEHPEMAQSLNSLALLCAHQGRYGEAEPLYQRALVIREKGFGPEHPKAIETRSALSALAITQIKAPQEGGP